MNLRITKNEIDTTLAAGITKVAMTNRSVGKRMQKIIKEHDRKKAVLENKKRKEDKQLDQLMAQQLNNKVVNTFANFEAEVEALTADHQRQAPQGETFPVQVGKSTEFADNL